MRHLRAEDYTVGWICALPIEMAASTAVLDSLHEPLPQHASDDNVYTLGSIKGHNVALACLPVTKVGAASAAIVATHMRFSFPSIRLCFMVGIGGGVPSSENDIRLGDVVVSKPDGRSNAVIQYDFGKTVRNGRFVQTGSLNNTSRALLNAVANLQTAQLLGKSTLPDLISELLVKNSNLASYPGSQHDLLFRHDYDHEGEESSCKLCEADKLVVDRAPRFDDKPIVHYGVIASSNQVMRDGSTRERLRKELNVLCFEGEASGLTDDLPYLVIRGICDYADSHKNDLWQPYAAVTAAACAKELLMTIPAVNGASKLRTEDRPAQEANHFDGTFNTNGGRAFIGSTFNSGGGAMSF